jgi:hypothetical protein
VAHGKGSFFCVGLVAVWLLGCGGSNEYQYKEAALGLGATVAMTGVYRATTGGCWANCTPGFACERKSGLCRRTECVPACPSTQTCVIEEDDRFRCIDMLGTGPLGATSSAPPSSAVPASSVAPPISSAAPN